MSCRPTGPDSRHTGHTYSHLHVPLQRGPLLAAVPAPVVGLPVAISLPVRVVVFLVVRHQIGQGEAVVGLCQGVDTMMGVDEKRRPS